MHLHYEYAIPYLCRCRGEIENFFISNKKSTKNNLLEEKVYKKCYSWDSFLKLKENQICCFPVNRKAILTEAKWVNFK